LLCDEKKKGRCVMRKVVLLIAVLLMAAPAMAASTVVVTATDDDVNCVTISYASDMNRIRAFGLAIEVNDANIVKVDSADPCYRIYPGQIIIEDGEITDYNLPYPEGDLGDANLAIEMGSLYTTDSNYAGDPNAGYNMIPPLSGILLKFYVDGDCTYTVTQDTLTGGIVMEDPCEPASKSVVVDDGLIPTVLDCVSEVNAPFYGFWASWTNPPKPKCWCYERNCRGDTDGKNTGPYWVAAADLNLFKQCYLKPIAVLQTITNGICCDFDHKATGPYRVASADLNIMKTYYLKPGVPLCPMDWDGDSDNDYLFWETP
jgi:hypothetical protein